MKILVVGGTVFLGKHIIIQLLNKGHKVSLFTRGKSPSFCNNGSLIDKCEVILGDRNTDDIEKLRGKEFDAVIDTCGYLPRQTRELSKILKDSVKNYVFISSVSVYKNFKTKGIDENFDLGTIKDKNTESITVETYGPLKVLCEKEVVSSFSEARSLIVRPGYIVGPDDPTDRFTYWPVKISKKGKNLIPKNSDFEMQIIDVRDLSEWIVNMVEMKDFGFYNVIGPDYKLTLAELVEKCNVNQIENKFIEVENDFIIEKKIELPLYIVENDKYIGINSVNGNKAIKKRLKFRSLQETINDTLSWFKKERNNTELKVGLSEKKEKEIIENYEII